ncbi:MAG TPA: C25 family cysteine peptidase [Candidatus Cloacimonadota bacterium]|nr:C25 family cysteine peptidase [Candidatus Cloacimonadota bacterium]
MKRSVILFLLGLLYVSLAASPVETVTTIGNSVNLTYSQSNPTNEPVTYNKTVALPATSAHVVIHNMVISEFDKDGNKLQTTRSIDQGRVYISNQFIMREMNGFTIRADIQKQVGDITSVIESLDYDVVADNSITLPTGLSAAFIPNYQKLASNYDTSYLRDIPESKPKMLIISHNVTAVNSALAPYLNWKRAKGFDVTVAYKQDIGTTIAQIKNYIANYYQSNHPDYVLIIGDVTGTYAVPTNIYTSPDGTENDADDNYYTMVEGNDYFPEMIIGRFSVIDLSSLLTIINKTISYEKLQNMTDTAWMHRALCAAGNYAEGQLQPVTPIQTSNWLREKMLAYGYSQVDTVYVAEGYNTYPGTSAVQASITTGVQFISYRGWGDVSGWHYPLFHTNNLPGTHNNSKLPIVMSIVCNTGDFANENVQQCFGETWMAMGTASSPNGCVAFVGPSDLHTKTNLNNSISSGMFSSILDHGNRIFGSAVLAGKVELYDAYPNDLAYNQNVAFYYHVYNILSDPSLNMWVLEPGHISVTLPDAIPQSTSSLDISLPGLDGAVVTGTKNNTTYSTIVVRNGHAILPVNPEETGNLKVTITRNNYIPYEKTLTVNANTGVGVMTASLDNPVLNAGTTANLTITLKNYSSSTVSNVTADLTSLSPYVTVSTATQNYGDIASGANSICTYTLNVTADCPANLIAEFSLSIHPTNDVAKMAFYTGGPLFTATETTGNLTVGTTQVVTVTLKNIGTREFTAGDIHVHSLATAATVLNGDFNNVTVAVGNTTTLNMNIQVQSDCVRGREIPLQFHFSNAGNYTTDCYASFTAGPVDNTAPTGPDPYGYYAYDSNDTGYSQHPTYNWIEIDPNLGGSGSTIIMTDDASHTIPLPFTFKYYGHDYNSITVCSNGWISFVTTWMPNFANINIPAALGPYAMVAPYWDDLKGMMNQADTTFADMRTIYYYDGSKFIIEWCDAYNNYTINLGPNASLEKFEIILEPVVGDDGNIIFQYHTINNPDASNNYATVGIENQTQMVGLQYSYANYYAATASPLTAGLAIKFTTNPPDQYVGNDDPNVAVPGLFLGQNYPNPFNPETRISFSLKQKADVSLKIYNVKGQLVRTLVNASYPAGASEITWNGTDERGNVVPSGVYMYRLETGKNVLTKKMILLK